MDIFELKKQKEKSLGNYNVTLMKLINYSNYKYYLIKIFNFFHYK